MLGDLPKVSIRNGAAFGYAAIGYRRLFDQHPGFLRRDERTQDLLGARAWPFISRRIHARKVSRFLVKRRIDL